MTSRDPQSTDAAVDRSSNPLHSLNFLDATPDPYLDQIVRITGDVFEVPVALVSMVDSDVQWIKSRHGSYLSRTGLDVAFCVHAVDAGEMLVVPDTRADERFAANPFVTGEPYIRFYAGAVMFAPGGEAIGTLCIMDHVPRSFGEADQRRLQRLARLAQTKLNDTGAPADERQAVDEDAVTGLPGRRTLTRRLARWLEASPSAPLAMVGVELGALAGLRTALAAGEVDRVLRGFVERLNAALPFQALFGRWSDNQFGILAPADVPGCTSAELADTVAEALATPIEVDGTGHRLDANVAVVEAPADGRDETTLLNKVQLAWEAARARQKSAGVSVSGADGSADIARRIALSARLDRAIVAGDIAIALQPRIELATGRIAGFEVLARWHDEELGPVPPGDFIPLAERLDCIGELGHGVLKRALQVATEWRKEGLAGVPLAINLSGAELYDPELPRRIRRALDLAEGLPASSVEFEVTETSIIDHVETAVETLRELQGLGTRFAIDDFGTGFSSFRYLRELPLDMLKVDRSFVARIAENHDDAAIVEAIVGMARTLGLSTVAEGIEDPEQLLFLQAYRCDTGQGFLFSPAVSPDEATRMLAEGRRFETDLRGYREQRR